MSGVNPCELEFVNFMKKHSLRKGEKKGLETHTLMGQLHKTLHPYRGSFYITGPDYEKFIELYENAVHYMDMHIVERPCKAVVPIVIDIDFNTHKKFKNERQYLDKHIEKVIEIYNDLFKEYLDISQDEMKAFVFEKPTPTYEEKKTGPICKDGFHILYPEIPLNVKKRFFFFDKAKKRMTDDDIFNDIPLTNTIDQILDPSVVSANGFLMYGSRKVDREPYTLTKIYNYDLSVENTSDYDDEHLISYLSIQRFSEDDEIQFIKKDNKKKLKKSDEDSDDESDTYEVEKIFEKYSNPRKKKMQKHEYDVNSDSDDDSNDERPKKNKKSKNKRYNQESDSSGSDSDKKRNKKSKNKYDDFEMDKSIKKNVKPKGPLQGKDLDIEMAAKLVMILKKSRADDYHIWSRIGWSLCSVSHDLLDVYKEFSKKSKKYDEFSGECEKIWKAGIESCYYGCTIATIYWYARKDNYEGYLKVLRSQINPLILQAKSGTHDDIANVVYQMYKPMYKCISIKQNMWYEFQNDYWVLLDSAYTLKEKIHNEVTKEFLTLHTYYLGMGGNDEADQDECVKQSGKIQKLYEKLKNNGFAKQVVECCAAKFYDQKFEKSLNENRLLVGFTNGVYDLKVQEFRRGTPDDLITMTVGYDYVPYSLDHPIVKKILKYFSEVQREEDMKEYVLRLMASFMDGRVKDQKFVLWTGSGCHAKDEKICMYDGTIKKVQDITLGNKVLGSDGRERKVNALYTGLYDMYNIYANDANKTNFKVTGNHRLALRSHYKPVITSSYDDVYDVDIYWVTYHAMIGQEKNELVEMTDKFYDKESANKFIKKMENSEEYVDYGNIIPMSVEEYQTTKHNIAKYYKLFKQNGKQEDDVNFSIEKMPEKQEYFGFELDGDKRYVMENGYVTYNSNGKSTTVDLLKLTLGDYAGTLKKEIVTRKVQGSGNATPDLADKVGKRFLVIQEPEKDDQIYVGAMKELSAGNDEIPARALYGNPFYYKPQFKMVLCCNKLPYIPSNDGGSWRRLRVTPWESHFVNPDDYKKSDLLPNQFFKNDDLMDDMKKWAGPFAWLLLKIYYPKYLKYGLMEPDKVKQYTNKYKKDSDTYLEYLADNTEKTCDKADKESVSVVYKLFKAWYKDSYSQNAPPLKEFTGYLEGNGYELEKGYITGIRLTLGD